MQELIKDLDNLLSKYGITINDAIRIHEEKQKHVRRLTQYHEDQKTLWQYFTGDRNNPCNCGSNCYHLEYNKIDNKIYGVCNACDTDIYEIRDEYIGEELQTGRWFVK